MMVSGLMDRNMAMDPGKMLRMKLIQVNGKRIWHMAMAFTNGSTVNDTRDSGVKDLDMALDKIFS